MKTLISLLAFIVLSIPAHAATVGLTWEDRASNESGYKVERAPGAAGGAFAQVRTTPSDMTGSLDRLLPAGATYRYRVRAWNAAGDSTFSNEAIVVVPAGPAPISNIPDHVIGGNASTGPIAFTLVDNAVTNFSGLTLTALSSNTVLVPASGIVLGGALGARTITVTPAAGRYGTTIISVTVTDGFATASDTFQLIVVDPIPAAPTKLTGGIIE